MLKETLPENNKAGFGGVFDESDHEDYTQYPIIPLPFSWEELNQDFGSNPSNYKDVTETALIYKEEEVDLRSCMIERPLMVSASDKFPKILNLFRQMQLRQLLVINDADGKLLGIITRKDLFQFMSL
jgi:CBS domain-containing protein